MKHLFTLFLVCLSQLVYSQDSAYVSVTVNDDRYGDPLHQVKITASYNDQLIYRTTGTHGTSLFEIPIGSSVFFQLSHNRYQSTKHTERISSRVEKGDTIFVELTMEIEPLKTQELNEMVVAAPGVPKQVYGSQRRHVEDFEIQKDGNLLLLCYPKRLKKGSELVLYDGINVLNSFQVPGTAEELLRDFRGNPHVVCKENVFGIYADKGNVGIARVDRDYFMRYVAPIVDTNLSKMYFSTFNPDYPAFEYFSFDALDSSYARITGVQDDLMMELYRSEYKWMDVRTKLWAKNIELETGTDAEVIIGANYFTQSIYYKEIYAPMFHRNDSLFVFDYYKDQLYTYDKTGTLMDSIGIYHHYQPKRTGWQKQLIQDKETGAIYAVFDRAGYTYLGWVDVKTGEITEQVKLEYRYVKKVAVHNNHVYYIYRPFESAQKKYLYKERLPYKFGKATVANGDELVKKE